MTRHAEHGDRDWRHARAHIVQCTCSYLVDHHGVAFLDNIAVSSKAHVKFGKRGMKKRAKMEKGNYF